jgi:peptidoglycan/LPS O-acetylase OafA/YrhL
VIALWATSASPYERESLRFDVLSVIGYVANWRFIATGHSYFEAFATPSPVQHLWSLAIEEQFYVAWPVLVVFGFAVARRGRVHQLAVIGLVVLATAASVMALAVTYDRTDPSIAYFATHTRAHELLIGAGAAIALAHSNRFAAFVRRRSVPIVVFGLTVIVALSLGLPDSSSFYYFGGSVAFSISAAALIATLTTQASSFGVARVLSFRPVAWIGTISYGVYLWHWPVITWLTPETIGVAGVMLNTLRIAVVFAVSSASYYCIERVIRRGHVGHWRIAARQVVAGAVVGALVLSITTVVVTTGARKLPDFVSNNRQLLIALTPHSRGAIGLVGDSVAMSLYPGFTDQAAQTSRSIGAATFPGCPVGDVARVDAHGSPFPWAERCASAAVRGQQQLVNELNPKVIVWLSETEKYDILVGQQILQAGTPAWENAVFADWDRVHDRLTSRGATIVLILPLHWRGSDPTECSGPNAQRENACFEPSLATNILRDVYVRWAGRHPDDVSVLQPDAALCPASRCPSVLDGVTLRRDRLHFTTEGARVAARRIVLAMPRDTWDPPGA